MIHLLFLDTEMAITAIPICLPTSSPSSVRHRRIPSKFPPKKCFPSGWNAMAHTAPWPPGSITVTKSYGQVAQHCYNHSLEPGTHRCSTSTSLLIAHSRRFEASGRTVSKYTCGCRWVKLPTLEKRLLVHMGPFLTAASVIGA